MQSDHNDLGFLNGGNLNYLEALYQESLDAAASGNGKAQDAQALLDEINQLLPVSQSLTTTIAATGGSQEWLETASHKQGQVSKLIMGYRALGHLLANIDPIDTMPRGDARELELEQYDLSDADLDTEFDTGDLADGGRKTLREILDYLQAAYCGPIAYEIRYLTSMEQREWLMSHVETDPVRLPLTKEEKINILTKLTAAEGLEKYLHTKYVGQKRFSLEGGDTLIPMLSDLIQQFGKQDVKEVIFGMAHRGRLNVLVNILGKAPADLFSEFEGAYETEDEDTQTGDVKYHQGASSDIQTEGGNVHVALSFNPSHLEIINPVVEGSARARQERRQDINRREVVPILMHGDAAFAGQGVVMETLNMSRTRGYSTGGTVHIIINNQIGFTTNTLDARSTLYCTEVAKLVQAPILHVNGDDPEAVVQAARLAMAYRMQFAGDVVIDLVCYRRHGHNEADEPSITQPVMYSKIKNHPTPREIYANKLIEDGVLTADQARALVNTYRDQLDAGHVVAGQVIDPNKGLRMVDWESHLTKEWDTDTQTSIDADRLTRLGQQFVAVPEDFAVHPRVKKVLDDRAAMVAGEKPMDWGCAELLAYGSLLQEEYKVRLSGQDAGRGTFSHRHATLHDQRHARTHVPLQFISENPSDFLVINSLLSEEAVLGFEYGYATTEPRTLVIWEGQFGDFVNGAQVVIDQFISSGEAKWSRVCGLTMFLPHGMEGQGPEHSSARLERFLQLCAENNMQVCVPTTPAQMFHMLRRQMIRPLRRPLIVMTPKSLLRHKLSVSEVSELVGGKFQTVIGEIDPIDPEAVKRVVICSGKVYFDLLEERRLQDIKDVSLLRLEQLHPFPAEYLKAEVEKFPNATQIVWCQEEPKNQGSWYQISYYLRMLRNKSIKQKLKYIGREGSPSPAVGYYKLHVEQQRKLVMEALTTSKNAVYRDGQSN
ncbi:MAG: 2-oxoglutarate dehydrogenase E1 component [Acidiferrobacterales bacterium]|nr:2-oxoglutarate dehydrogenase E1 component [Acidiferrobacterales bacterium]